MAKYEGAPLAELGGATRIDTIANCDNHVKIIVFKFVFHFTSNTTVYDCCNFCNSRVCRQFSITKNLLNVSAYARLVNVKKRSHSFLRTPNGFVFINHLNAIFLTLCHKDKEFGCAISYFNFLHIFKFLESSII